jgi:hypothetical protein
LRAKHEGLGFDGREEKYMNTKTTFLKEKDIVELAYSSEKRAATNESFSTSPPHPSYGRLWKG